MTFSEQFNNAKDDYEEAISTIEYLWNLRYSSSWEEDQYDNACLNTLLMIKDRSLKTEDIHKCVLWDDNDFRVQLGDQLADHILTYVDEKLHSNFFKYVDV